MLSETQKAGIVKLRGLGYTQKEIGERLGLAQNQVSYHLKEINEEALQKGDDAVFISVLADGYLPKILANLQTIKALTKNK